MSRRLLSGWALLLTLAAACASSEPAPPNLLPNSGLTQGRDVHGLAQDLTEWGAAQVALSSTTARPATSSQSVTLPAGATGGVFVQVPVKPSVPYTQSAYIDVVSLDHGATAAMILEWYDPALKLLGYQMDKINIAGGGFGRRVQTVRSPQGAALARFVVNISGGGQILVDAPQLESGTTATGFELTPPNA